LHERWRIFLLLPGLIALVGATGQAQAATVERGPYLQLGTPSSVVVRWRTNLPTDSVVRYGTDPQNLDLWEQDSDSTKEHSVELIGLASDTRYYYSVGTSSEELSEGADHTFTTPPVSGQAKPTRIWVIGDSGTANSNAEAVRDAYLPYHQTRPTDLWLMLGDNAYSDGTDDEYQEAVFDMYPSLLTSTVLWPTLGNHDGHSADSDSQTGPYYEIFTLPKQGEAGGVSSFTEAYYSFDYANIHFICLDSHDTDTDPSSPMLAWLEDDLAATQAQWIIAFWHHPPYSKGSHDSDSSGTQTDMRANFLPTLEDWGVDLVLSGHSHSYERSFLLDSHYGESSTLVSANILDAGDGRVDGDGAYEKPPDFNAPHEGAVYIVAGSSGKVSGGGDLDHPAMFLSIRELGSLILDVDDTRLDVRFLRETGLIEDYFTLLKGGCGNPNCTTYTLSVAMAGGGSGTVSSSPAGIDCGIDCSEDYDQDTVVTLTATADPGSSFVDWSGDADCSDGQVTMTAARSCVAQFDLGGPRVFADGFESGDSSGWSSSVGD
jgi:hypothetical protein